MTASPTPHVLLLSIPGLRPEDLPRMPTLERIARSGGCLPLAPPLPAVTCPVQATLTTGHSPAGHGILSNGLFDRGTKHLEMWISPDGVHRMPRIWDQLKQARPGIRTAAWFLLQSKHATADLVCLPAPKHNPDGSETMWCHTRPEGLYERLRDRLGEFPLHKFWGPVAGIESSRWIAASFLEASRDNPPDFACVYLPHLDYASQAQGPDSPAAHAACAALDAEIATLVEGYASLTDDPDAILFVVGEYRIRPVADTLFPNRLLREAGLLTVSEDPDGDRLDIGSSRAWTLADHQIGHVYIADPADRSLVEDVATLFRGRKGVERLLSGAELIEAGLTAAVPAAIGDRCGDLVIVSAADSWQAYYPWLDDSRAPGFARTIDIHRKPGYDPLELHLDRSRLPAIAIPLDTTLVKGSHGAVDPANPHETILITSRPGIASGPVAMDEIAGMVKSLFGCGDNS